MPHARALAEARLAAVVESSDAAIVTTDSDWVVETWNPAAERLFGYPADEMVGRSILDLVPPDQHVEARSFGERVRAGERVPPYEAVRLRKDGTAVPVSVTLWPVRDDAGRFVGLAAIYTDLTERRRAEAELRQSEERFRGAFEHTNVATVLTDADNRFVRANAAFGRLFGYSPDGMVGMTMADVTHPDDLAESYARREGLLAGE